MTLDTNTVTACGPPPTQTPTPTSTPTNTPVLPTDTPTSTPTNTPPVPTDTPTNTPTNTPPVSTNTPTNTPTGIQTITPTPTPPPGSADLVVAESGLAEPGRSGPDSDLHDSGHQQRSGRRHRRDSDGRSVPGADLLQRDAEPGKLQLRGPDGHLRARQSRGRAGATVMIQAVPQTPGSLANPAAGEADHRTRTPATKPARRRHSFRGAGPRFRRCRLRCWDCSPWPSRPSLSFSCAARSSRRAAAWRACAREGAPAAAL